MSVWIFFRAYVYISFVLLLLWLPKFVSSWSNFLNLACVSVCMFHCVRLCVSVCNYATRNVFLLKINDNYKSFDFMTNGRRFNIKTSFFSNIKINLYFIKMDFCICIIIYGWKHLCQDSICYPCLQTGILLFERFCNG